MKLSSSTVEAMTLPFTLTLLTKHKIEGEKLLEQIMLQIENDLKDIENKFSAFKTDSLVSQFNQNNPKAILDKDFQKIYAESLFAKETTLGHFNPYFDGKFNPTGFVKGWAIETVFQRWVQPLLDSNQVLAACLNGGGDMVCRVLDGIDFNWKIGIENPDNSNTFLARFQVKNLALASSGLSKRGQHIKNTKSIQQVTVLNSSMTQADIWATALMTCTSEQAQKLIKINQLDGLYIQNHTLFFFKQGDIHVQKP